jgi:hypothetical protein
VLTEEKLDDIGVSLEHTLRKSLKRLAQEQEYQSLATKPLKRRPYKTTVIHALQPHDSASRVVEGEISPQVAFFNDEACFRLQGYINTQNNRC